MYASRVVIFNSICSVVVWMFIFTFCNALSFADFTLVFENGINDYNGTVDIEIKVNEPNLEIPANSGVLLYDGNNIPDEQNILLIRFDDLFGSGPNQIPVGSEILSAIMRWKVQPNPGGGNSGQLAELLEMIVPFVEGSYSDQPFGNSLPAAGSHFRDENFVLIPGPDHNAVVNITVTNSLNAWANGEIDNNGWILLPGGSNGVIIRSSDYKPDQNPELIVDTPIGEFRFMDGRNGYDGVHDTSIAEESLDRNEGRSSRVLADGGDNDGTWPLVRFDNLFGNAPGQIPPGTQINSAKLLISVFNSGNLVSMYDLNPGHPFNDFSDQEATDAGIEPTNFGSFGDPQINNGGDFFDFNNPLDLIPAGLGGLVELNVTSSIQRYSGGEENSGWIFHHEGAFGGVADGIEWRSSEWPGEVLEQQPELIVQTNNGEFRFMDGVNGYDGTIDTSIAEESVTRNEGRRIAILSDGGDTPDGTWPLLRFDNIIGTASSQIPPNSIIESAVVRISVFNPGEKTSIHDLAPGHPFTELANSEADALGIAPTNYETFGDIRAAFDAGNLNSFYNLNAELDAIATGSTGNFDLDVTSSIQRYANGEENTGWIFHHGGAFGGSGDGVEWRASEWKPEPPSLTITASDGTVYSFQNGINGYESGVDTYLNSGEVFDLPLGLESNFWVDRDDRGGQNYSLLRFDNITGNGPGQVPPGTSIQSAEVVMFISNEGAAATVHNLLPGVTFDDENTSFDSFDLANGDPEFGVGIVREDAVIATTPGGGFEGPWLFDVTPVIQNHINGANNSGWVFIPNLESGNGLGFSSADGTIPPGQTGAMRLTVRVAGEPNEGTAVRDFMLYD